MILVASTLLNAERNMTGIENNLDMYIIKLLALGLLFLLSGTSDLNVSTTKGNRNRMENLTLAVDRHYDIPNHPSLDLAFGMGKNI